MTCSLLPLENWVCCVQLVNREMLPSDAVGNLVTASHHHNMYSKVVRDVRLIFDTKVSTYTLFNH